MPESKFKGIDRRRVRLVPACAQKWLVSRNLFAKIAPFPDSMPDALAARNLKALAAALKKAKKSGAAHIWGIGAHVIKVGLSPLLIDLMERGFISALAMNGAAAIHDFEIAKFGATSEDVAQALDDGTFGMTRETGLFINAAATAASKRNIGFGEALGREIIRRNLPCREISILAAAYKSGIPATVHVAIGTDIVHMHPSMDGAATGKASYRDFLILAREAAKLEDGVFINFGSAVIIPEVFLKALAMARNTGHKVGRLTTANFDMYRHYRPTVNVLERPTRQGGQAFDFSGHHEIMLPLLHHLLVYSAGGKHGGSD